MSPHHIHTINGVFISDCGPGGVTYIGKWENCKGDSGKFQKSLSNGVALLLLFELWMVMLINPSHPTERGGTCGPLSPQGQNQ